MAQISEHDIYTSNNMVFLRPKILEFAWQKKEVGVIILIINERTVKFKTHQHIYKPFMPIVHYGHSSWAMQAAREQASTPFNERYKKHVENRDAASSRSSSTHQLVYYLAPT